MLRTGLMLVWIILSVQMSAQLTFRGTISDQNGNALVGANVYFENSFLGTVSDARGQFVFRNLRQGEHHLKISYVGYKGFSKTLEINADTSINYSLSPEVVLGEEVTVRASRAGSRDPIAFSEISKEEIKQNNMGRDLPYLLSFSPSMVVSSDAGNGVGYTGMRIRGTDATRINFTLDGVPLNDAESHIVYFVNTPDLASSIENVQIQRGVGTSTNGSSSFGASLNFRTNSIEHEPFSEISSGYGSFNTTKNTVKLGTGLLNDHFSLELRLSKIHSDGYIDRAFSDLKSFSLSAGWYTGKNIIKLNILSGNEKTYQAWDGVPGDKLKTHRTFNGKGAYTDAKGEERYYNNETDNYRQDHFQLHYSRQIVESLYFNAALHFTPGNGYYEQYKEDQKFSKYTLPLVILGTDTISSTDLIRRKWLDNQFYGTLFSFTYKKNRVDARFGGGWNKYLGEHYGTIIWAEYSGTSEKGYRWYENDGTKRDYNLYGKLNYSLTDKINLFGDMQLRGIHYEIIGSDDDLRDIGQEHDFLFFNPKLGLNYSPSAGQRAYFSVSVASREPSRSNFTDADPNLPVPRSEKLVDYEAGYQIGSENATAGINLYFMDYNNQLVLTGEINDVGSAVMSNVKDSYRAGIEIQGGVSFRNSIKWNANLTLSRNRILGMVSFVDNWSYWDDPENEPYQFVTDLGETEISFSPAIIAGSVLHYDIFSAFNIELQSKYVGKQYIDNTMNRDRMLDAYFVNDLKFGYSIPVKWAKAFELNLLIANIFNEKYISNAWVYRYLYEGVEGVTDGYFPQAGFNFFAGASLRF